MPFSQVIIGDIRVTSYTVPTDAPEADGTLRWNSTTLVLAEIAGGGETGVGYTYGSKAVVILARELATKCLQGQSPGDISRINSAMAAQVRNDGTRGVASLAISALDIALWDLKAKLLGCSACDLFGQFQDAVMAYGSGGFTSYSDRQLEQQLGRWARSGMRAVKMKIGANPEDDPRRVRLARQAAGPDVEVFVDANGAYSPKKAIALAERLNEAGVSWFEEPVSSDRLEDLRFVRRSTPPQIDVAAGEYGYDALYFRRMLEAEAVDVLQLDATRCKGFSGFLNGAAVAESFGCPLSAHCAPTLHMHVGCAVPNLRHVEYFHDHARIEQMLFDGFIPPDTNGMLRPDRSRPGLGIVFKHQDAQRFAD